MTSLDLVVFLAAGIVGAQTRPHASRAAWAIVAVWAGLKILHII